MASQDEHDLVRWFGPWFVLALAKVRGESPPPQGMCRCGAPRDNLPSTSCKACHRDRNRLYERRKAMT